jgi:hypothetical protein
VHRACQCEYSENCTNIAIDCGGGKCPAGKTVSVDLDRLRQQPLENQALAWPPGDRKK